MARPVASTPTLTLSQRRRIFALLAFSALAVSAWLWSQRGWIWRWYLSGFMFQAIQRGDTAGVQDLLRRGADPNREGAGGLMGGTPLTWAAAKGDIPMLRLLIANGAKVDKRLGYGYTAADAARVTGHPEAAEFLSREAGQRR